MFLSKTETDALDAQIAHVEAVTGVQVVAAVIGKADAYAELPWKAFALGVSVAALAVVWADAMRPGWVTAHTALLLTVTVLAVGAACALLAVFVPVFARLFLPHARRDVEVAQYAQALFLRHELFKTRDRNGILILVCRFERKMHILPDTGLHRALAAADLRAVMDRMTPLLRDARPADALQAGIGALQELLAGKGFKGHAGAENELPDRPIEEAGA
jgi:putative membrane protein